MDEKKYIALISGDYTNYLTTDTNNAVILDRLMKHLNELPQKSFVLSEIYTLIQCIGYAKGINSAGVLPPPDMEFYEDLECMLSLKLSVLIAE